MIIKEFKHKNPKLKTVAQVVLISDRLRVMVEINAGFYAGYCDWPIRYRDGGISYDYRERIPQYVESLVNQAYDYLEALKK